MVATGKTATDLWPRFLFPQKVTRREVGLGGSRGRAEGREWYAEERHCAMDGVAGDDSVLRDRKRAGGGDALRADWLLDEDGTRIVADCSVVSVSPRTSACIDDVEVCEVGNRRVGFAA